MVRSQWGEGNKGWEISLDYIMGGHLPTARSIDQLLVSPSYWQSAVYIVCDKYIGCNLTGQ